LASCIATTFARQSTVVVPTIGKTPMTTRDREAESELPRRDALPEQCNDGVDQSAAHEPARQPAFHERHCVSNLAIRAIIRPSA
jgi:hypothetical protein